MKKLILTALTVVGFAAGVFAQGYFILDGGSIANGVALNTAGNYSYNGPFNFEVWLMNGAPSTATINAINAFDGTPGGGVSAYNLLGTANGWIEEPAPTFTYAGGLISMAQAYKMPDVSPGGSTVTVAIAGWNQSQTSWASMLQNVSASTRAGVLAWAQPTVNYSALPLALPPANAWPAQDLILTSVPEPSVFALAGLGAAALLIFRRRK